MWADSTLLSAPVASIVSICSPSVHRLTIGLKHLRACNAVIVKLVDQENLMAQYGDERARPNICVSQVNFRGYNVILPKSLALSC